MTSSLVPDKSLIELGAGAQLALFGFRACAFGHTKCCCLLNMFKDVFGDKTGGRVLGQFMGLAEYLGQKGQRRLDLSVPNATVFTYDEASILSALSSFQHGEFVQARAHLTWLLARSPRTEEINVVSDLVMYFSARDLIIRTPEYQPVSEQSEYPADRPNLELVQSV
ncbi:MAG: hypothetical protein AAFZ91_11060 [Pseudomonadota bacterium]